MYHTTLTSSPETAQEIIEKRRIIREIKQRVNTQIQEFIDSHYELVRDKYYRRGLSDEEVKKIFERYRKNAQLRIKELIKEELIKIAEEDLQESNAKQHEMQLT